MIAVAVGDPAATRTVYAVVIALAAIGVVLIIVAVWLVRQTRVDPELLAPLERMDTRRWERRDPATQRRMLDEVRPEGAEPLHRERAAPALDEEFEAELPAVAGFDDLKDGDGADDASDDGSGDEESAADEDGSADDGSADAVEDGSTSTAAEAGDNAFPEGEAVVVDGVDEGSAAPDGEPTDERGEDGPEDAQEPLDAEDTAAPADGSPAKSGNRDDAERSTDAADPGEHTNGSEVAAAGEDVGDDAGKDADAGTGQPVAGDPEGSGDGRRSAVVSAQD